MSTFVFLLVAATAVLHASWNFLTKKVAGNLGVLILGAWTGTILLLPFALTSGTTLEELRNALPYMIATGMVHTFYFTMLAKAYKHGDISSVYPIARGLSVAGTGIAATILLGESISPIGMLGISSISLGAFLVGYNKSHGRLTRGVSYAILVSVSIIAYSIIDKTAVGMVSPTVYAVGLFGFAASFLTILNTIRHPNLIPNAWRKFRYYAFAIGIGQVGVYVIVLFAYQLAQVSYVVAVRELSVVIGALLGVKLLKENLSRKKMLGISAIALGLVLIKMA